jgi:hypothetical protein
MRIVFNCSLVLLTPGRCCIRPAHVSYAGAHHSASAVLPVLVLALLGLQNDDPDYICGG